MLFQLSDTQYAGLLDYS